MLTVGVGTAAGDDERGGVLAEGGVAFFLVERGWNGTLQDERVYRRIVDDIVFDSGDAGRQGDLVQTGTVGEYPTFDGLYIRRHDKSLYIGATEQ